MTLKRIIWCVFIASLCCAAYFQLFTRTTTASEGPNAQEIIAAAEAIRNEAVAQPHKFGIETSDVHTLRITDSVPSSKPGVRHVYLAQEVNGVPIANTLLSTVVKLAPSSNDGNSLDGGSNNYLRATGGKSTSSKSTIISNKEENIVKTVSLKHAQALVKNADNCINTNIPLLSADEALSSAVKEVLGVKNANFRRRVLKADDVGNSKDVRQQSIFEPHDVISIDDTHCQLSYWSIANNGKADEDDCNVRLSWECKVKQNRTNYMHIFVDAVEGNIINLSKFGPSGETDENDKNVDRTSHQGVHPSRRRLSAFSAVQYPKENPCPSCPRFGENRSDKTFDSADIEPLTLVQNPEYIDSSPNGWLKIGDTTYDETQGNNVRAAFSVIQDSIDPYASGVTAFATDSSSNVFDYSHQSIVHKDNVGLDKHVSSNLEAAVVNAFYWANIVHDIYYQYGFNEESGNFQEENFGRGGKGGDSVVVEVRETSTFNNAFFVNGKDGENPLLLLYLFLKSDETVLKVDGEEYKATPFVFGPTEFNLPDAPIVHAQERVCQNIRANDYVDSIVVIDSGYCSFSSKVKNAQNRGAAAVILVVDPWDRPAFSMSDADDSIYIPSVSITTDDALRLLASLKPTSKSELGPGLIVRDGAFDSSIIIHEYCHGITTRLTGGPSTTMCLNQDTSRELGKEGWEDICSLFITATNTTGRTRTIGSFASWSLFGIRPFPYSTDMAINPTTYGRLNRNPGSHFLGTIFGSMLWELYWSMIDYEEENGRVGFNENKYDSQIGGSNIAMQLIMEGLKIQPCSPSFVQSRDAILLADQILYDGEYECVIWHSFAKRGLGESAVASPLGATLNVTEAFDVPSYCVGPMLSLASHNYTIVTGDGDAFIDNCELLTLAITVENTGFGILKDLQLVGVSSNFGATTVTKQLPMKLGDLQEKGATSLEVDLKVEGLVFGQPLELEAKFTAAGLVEPLPVFITFTNISSDVVAQEKLSWKFSEGRNDWTGIDGYFTLEPSRSTLTVGDVVYYSPVAKFGPQKFSIVNAFLEEGRGLGCEEVEEDRYAGSVVLLKRGECDFTVKVQNAQNGGALAVIISNYEDEYPFNMDEENLDITIPSVMVGYTAGERIKQQIYKDLATLSFDANRKEMLSSHLSLPEQCNRVRSPSFVLNDNSDITVWINFGIKGMAKDLLYDRANIGLVSKRGRVTIKPDGGHRYNSYGIVHTKNAENCPAPGINGWRKGTGPAFKKVMFSSDSLRESNMIGEIVELEIALATGVDTYGSFFAIQSVELTNVGILMPDKGSLCSIPVSPSDLGEINTLPDGLDAQQGSTFDGEDNLIEDNVNEDKGRDEGLEGGLIFFILCLSVIAVASLAYFTRSRKRKVPERSVCVVSSGSDLENPMHILDEVEITLHAAVPAPVPNKDEMMKSENAGSQSVPNVGRTFSASTGSFSNSSVSSSASVDEESDEDEAHGLQSDDELVDEEGASRMLSFINIFVT